MHIIRTHQTALFFLMTGYFIFISGCHPETNPAAPGEVRTAAVRWVDVEPNGAKSGIEVTTTALLPTTVIEFALPYDGFVTLSILDGGDNPVIRLINNEHRPAGVFSCTFDASNLASGVYVFTLQVRAVTAQNGPSNIVFSRSRKMMLLK